MVKPKSVSVWSGPWSGICFASTCWRNPQSCFASSTAITGLKLSDVVAPLPLCLSRSLPLVQSLWSACTLSRLFTLSLFPSLCSVLHMSHTPYKTDERLRAGDMPVVLGGNFPQHSRPTVYICHFLFSPPFEASRVGGCSGGVWHEVFSSKVVLVPHSFFRICTLRKLFKNNLILF